MATITLEINENSKEGKTLLDLIHLFSGKKKAVKIIESSENIIHEEEIYNPAFVKMVLESAASKKRYTIDTNDVWGSLGLK
jgi:AAA15 family ATPase/GTPase